MNLLMISGDRHLLSGKRGAFWYALQEMQQYWDRIDVITPYVHSFGENIRKHGDALIDSELSDKVFFHPSPWALFYQKKWITKKGKQLIDTYHHSVMTVHSYPPFYNDRGARTLHRLTGVPYVMEVHHIVGYPVASTRMEYVGFLLSRAQLQKYAENAKAVRAVNKTVAVKLSEWGVPSQKISIVPSFYLDGEVLRLDLQPPKSYDVSFCGRLVPNKGLDELIEAISKFPSLSLLIIGEGPLRKPLEKYAKDLGCENRVTFLGWLPTMEAVIGAIQTARIFVMCSRSEGGPRVALEAMASGMPIIATPVGVMPEVVQHGVNGLMTDGTPRDMEEKILLLLKDEDYREKLANEAKKILDRFDRTVLIKQYADFLQSLA